MSAPDRWYRKEIPDDHGAVSLRIDAGDMDGLPYGVSAEGTDTLWLDREDLWALWAVIGSVLTEEPPAWAVGRITPTDAEGNPIKETSDA